MMRRRSSNIGDHIEMVDMSYAATRYSAKTTDESYYLDSKGLEITPDLVKASATRINNLELHPIHLKFNTSLKNEHAERLSKDMLEFRKGAILYLYVYVLGSPPSDEWGGLAGTLTDIINRLSLPKGSRTRIKEMLEARYRIEIENEETLIKSSGRPRLIEESSDEAAIIILSLERGLGLGNATVLVNEFRREKGLDPVSYRSRIPL
jgi:hypothetical protein